MTEKWGELEPEASTFEERLRLSRPKQTLCCIFEPLIHKESFDHGPSHSSVKRATLEPEDLDWFSKRQQRFRVSINLKVSLTRAKTCGRERRATDTKYGRFLLLSSLHRYQTFSVRLLNTAFASEEADFKNFNSPGGCPRMLKSWIARCMLVVLFVLWNIFFFQIYPPVTLSLPQYSSWRDAKSKMGPSEMKAKFPAMVRLMAAL